MAHERRDARLATQHGFEQEPARQRPGQASGQSGARPREKRVAEGGTRLRRSAKDVPLEARSSVVVHIGSNRRSDRQGARALGAPGLERTLYPRLNQRTVGLLAAQRELGRSQELAALGEHVAPAQRQHVGKLRIARAQLLDRRSEGALGAGDEHGARKVSSLEPETNDQGRLELAGLRQDSGLASQSMPLQERHRAHRIIE
jgi:hypothetical protein